MLGANTLRNATVTTALGYCDENGVKIFVGKVEGIIADLPRGSNGFGYDSIFIPDGQTKTFAEMTDTEKDIFSMRARATQAMIDKLL